jgi:hypothetical protein
VAQFEARWTVAGLIFSGLQRFAESSRPHQKKPAEKPGFFVFRH